MLEGHRVDDVNGSICRVMSKEQTVNCLVRIFESMADDFGVGEVVEVKSWAGHALIAPCVRIRRGRVPARWNRDVS